MAADRAFQRPLPRLIEGFDHVDAETFPLAARKHVSDDARLIGRRRQRALAHAARARPADFADHDLLAGEVSDHALADCIDVIGGGPRRDRIVFPIGQDVDGDEIHRACELAIAQPELPHVGIGHRRLDPRLHAADRFAKHRRRHFAAQQHLVADDDRAHHVRKPVRQRDAGADLILRAVGVARHPQAKQHFQTVPLRDFGNLVEPEIDRIGANAIGHLRQLGEILFDLGGLDFGREIERRLRAAERRIGDAIELLAGTKRRRRHRHRGAEPPPCGKDNRGRQSEQTDRFMHLIRGVPRHAGSADMLRHFNQDHVGRWTTAVGLAISDVTGSRGMGRKSDPFGVQITQHVHRETTTTQTQPVRPCPFIVRLSLALLIAAGAAFIFPPAFAQSGDTKSRRQASCGPAGRCRQRSPAPGRRVRRSHPVGKRAGRQPGMRLARPPGGRADVAGRHGHRLPPPRPLRPVRLPRPPYPGGVPLRRPPGRQYRSENTPEPQCPGAFLLAKPDRRASDRSGTAAAAPASSGSRRPAAQNSASAPAAAGTPNKEAR